MAGEVNERGAVRVGERVYRVNAVYPAIQGEGAMAGKPMVVVRMQGCDVACPWCDTKEGWALDGGEEMGEGELIENVRRVAGTGIKWVMLTGGEPLLQNVAGLVERLSAGAKGFQVCLETSGVMAGLAEVRRRYGRGWIVLSPKEHCPPLFESWRAADEVKFVVTGPGGLEWFENKLLWFCGVGGVGQEVSLQPMSLDGDLTRLCIERCLETGWSLSVQVHRMLGLP